MLFGVNTISWVCTWRLFINITKFSVIACSILLCFMLALIFQDSNYEYFKISYHVTSSFLSSLKYSVFSILLPYFFLYIFFHLFFRVLILSLVVSNLLLDSHSELCLFLFYYNLQFWNSHSVLLKLPRSPEFMSFLENSKQ